MDLCKHTPKNRHTALILAKTGLALLLTVGAAQAQASRFMYQGKLTDGAAPANGTYDFQFALWDSASGGTQIGSTQAVSSVSVTGGIFTVTLDFGVNAFPGGDRFLEIGVRPGGGGAFTTLSPRQQLSSTPYAIRTLNAFAADTLSAACSGCVSDANIGGVAASKISGTVSSANGGTGLNAAGASGNFLKSNGSVWTSVPLSPADFPSGSGNYIQNTTSLEANSNFNISGDGTAGGTLSGNIVNATTQYNLHGSNFASAPLENTFVNTIAGGNRNSFFGLGAGFNQTGSNNSFFGWEAGLANTTSDNNTFIGRAAGRNTTMAGNNTFIGANVGGTGGITNATAIGANAFVTQSNSLVLGSINGVNGAVADTNVGIGTSSPSTMLTVNGSGLFNTGVQVGTASQGANFLQFANSGWRDSYVIFRGSNQVASMGMDSSGSKLQFFTGSTSDNSTARVTIDSSGNVGISTNSPANKLSVAGSADFSGNVGVGLTNPSVRLDVGGNVRAGGDLEVDGQINVHTLVPGGQTLCFNAGLGLNTLANCSSSLRYKKDLQPFAGGLNVLKRLRPITFTWKDHPERDLGLGAEDVAAIEPLLTFRNAKGEIEGVKYEKLTVVLINAVKEQQTQIEKQHEQLKQEKLEIDGLKKLVCWRHRNAAACR